MFLAQERHTRLADVLGARTSYRTRLADALCLSWLMFSAQARCVCPAVMLACLVFLGQECRLMLLVQERRETSNSGRTRLVTLRHTQALCGRRRGADQKRRLMLLDARDARGCCVCSCVGARARVSLIDEDVYYYGNGKKPTLERPVCVSRLATSLCITVCNASAVLRSALGT